MLRKILELIESEDLEFDFYINPHKVSNVESYTIGEDITIEFTVDLDYTEDTYTGGDWDEIMHDYIETGREVKLTAIYDSEGDEIEFTKREKSLIESAIDEQLNLNLY